MEIIYSPQHHIFLIQMKSTTYAFAVNADRRLVHLYWGKKLNGINDLTPLCDNLNMKMTEGSLSPSLTNDRYEYHAGEFYSYEEQALDVRFADGVNGAQLAFRDYEISEDKSCLTVVLQDEYYPLIVTLHYQIYENQDLIVRHAAIHNEGDAPMVLEKVQSASFHFPREVPYRLTHYAGSWGAEYQRKQQFLDVCRTVIQNNHGNTSGPHAVPFVMLDSWGKADELSGEVYLISLHWSGNFKITCERSSFGEVTVTAGIHDDGMRMILEPGNCYETPKITAGYSCQGFGGIREQLYDYQLDYILPRRCAHNPFPVLYNSWYPYEFLINEEKIAGLIDRAADIGVELFVVDDGWMPGRFNDRKGLGDWYACKECFPNGLKPLADRAHEKGMKFGLWIEPEMVNPDSNLYKEHPDWVLQSPTRNQLLTRNQLALNLAREDVLQYLLDTLDRIITEYGLDYLKWDMNRYLSDFGWKDAAQKQRDRLPVTLIENVYRIWQHMNEKYPELLLENCAHGGARADYGMLKFADRMNRSDNAFPLDVILLHEGFTDMIVPKCAGGAGTLNGAREIPYAFRENLGFTGSLSIGANLLTCTVEELKQYRESIEQFKEERADLQDAYVYHLLSARETPYAVWQYVRRDRKAFTLFGFCHGRHYPHSMIRRVQMTGLLSGELYECVSDEQFPEAVGKIYSAESLMQIGVQLPLNKNFASVRRSFRLVEEI